MIESAGREWSETARPLFEAARAFLVAEGHMRSPAGGEYILTARSVARMLSTPKQPGGMVRDGPAGPDRRPLGTRIVAEARTSGWDMLREEGPKAVGSAMASLVVGLVKESVGLR